MDIKELNDKKIQEHIEQHREFMGVVKINVFSIDHLKNDSYKPYDLHLAIANEGLKKEISKFNGQIEFDIDYSELSNSGKKIDVGSFLGIPHLENKKHHIIDKIKQNKYFCEQDKIFDNQLPKPDNNNYHPKGFIDALLYPPYGLVGVGKTIGIDNYLANFCEFFFDLLAETEIYTWSTDCSDYFDDGKEWWGEYFFTVYNPKKQWYVCLIAAATD